MKLNKPIDINLIDNLNIPFYVVLGASLSHSYSPYIHNLALKYYNIPATYYAIQCSKTNIDKVSYMLNLPYFMGANITIPYKTVAMKWVHDIQPQAKDIGAINTIYRKENILMGANTDINGCISVLKPYKQEIIRKKCLIYGSGGASKTLQYILLKWNVKHIYVVSRHPQSNSKNFINKLVSYIGYNDVKHYVSECKLIVNTTPLGMYPDVDNSPITLDVEPFLKDKICFDMVYNPYKTKFIKQAEKKDNVVLVGLTMFLKQAAVSFSLWTGHIFPLSLIKKQCQTLFKI